MFVGEQLVGLIDAKKPAEDVASTIDVQIKDYAKNIKPEHAMYVIDNWFGYSVPFLFATNGRPYLEQLKTKSGIWFLDARKPSNISYPIRNWFSPDDLMAKLKHNVEEANEALTVSDDSYMTDSNGLNLRDYQIKAINKVSQAIIDGQQNVLIAMATGTGKTRTVLGLIYKMLESKRFKRILFLVDRTALGGQAMDTFKDVKLKELQTLCQIYDVKDIEDRTVDIETKVSVSTVQGLLKRTILAEKPELTSGAFDLIIVDEAHRGYILDKEMTEDELLYDSQDDYLSKYKQVIEYFDAVKVGLTATPALHTTQIFGSPVFTYSYREAVIDGWLVDHDPPYIINTDFNTSTVTFKKGEQLGMFDPNTGELINGETLQDELDFDVADFNRTIVLPDHTRKVLQEVSKYINPESREKTLIFAVNDNHADNIVNETKYTVEEAIYTVLDALNLNEEQKEYLFTKIQKGDYVFEKIDKDSNMRKGFNFTEIEDSNYHDMKSVVRNYNFSTTPEDVILKMTEHSLVVGISATAKVDTCIGNYDKKYLEAKLKDKNITSTQEDEERVGEEFKKTISALDGKYQIHTSIIDDFNVFSDKEKCALYINELFKDGIKEKYVAILEDARTKSYYFLIELKLAYLTNGNTIIVNYRVRAKITFRLKRHTLTLKN